jgi:hypothetical protein
MSMVAPRRSRILIALALAAALAGCDRTPPEQQQGMPTGDRLSATPNAVGIPYDRVIVIRHGDRLIALSLTASSQLGDRVDYHWVRADDSGGFSRPESLEQGTGEAIERPYTGRVALPDRLVLTWSRGSDTFGWLYWPEQPTDYAVYSRPFAALGELDGGLHDGRWLEREMFQK